ncbi:hypothetical protein ACQ4PT_002478 [Festuca glaucescens]
MTSWAAPPPTTMATSSTTSSTTFSSIVDISDAFVWVQCPAPPALAFSSIPCASQTCLSMLNITAADCDSVVSGACEYVTVYSWEGEGINTTGYIADQTFTVVGAVVGFSRGAYSFVSQLNISKFSYFLSPGDADSSEPDSQQSVVLLGEAAVPQTRRSHSTPLLRSAAYPDYYYVKLTGIQVDGEDLGGIPKGAFDLAAGGTSGGLVMSTLIPITYLQSLTTVHYFYKDNATGLQCLTLLPMPASLPFSTVLGTLLQTGTNMIYDVDGGQLTFEKAVAPPAGKQVSLMVIAYPLLAWVLLLL